MYGLLRSYYGCPDATDWSTGSIHLTYNQHEFNWSQPSHLYGIKTRREIKLSFCMAKRDVNDEIQDEIEFPEGPFCLLKGNTQCPQGSIY